MEKESKLEKKVVLGAEDLADIMSQSGEYECTGTERQEVGYDPDDKKCQQCMTNEPHPYDRCPYSQK